MLDSSSWVVVVPNTPSMTLSLFFKIFINNYINNINNNEKNNNNNNNNFTLQIKSMFFFSIVIIFFSNFIIIIIISRIRMILIIIIRIIITTTTIKPMFLGYGISFRIQVNRVRCPCQNLAHEVQSCHTQAPRVWHHLANPSYLGLLVLDPYYLGMTSFFKLRPHITCQTQVTWI